jgi:hypothetical protein
VQPLRACCNRAATELQQSFNKGCNGSLHHRTGRHTQTQFCCTSVAALLQLCCRSVANLLQLCCSSSRSAYVSIRQHTSVYVDHTVIPHYLSIRQHTSAYVSIRQHTWTVPSSHTTSVYVNIPKNT